MHISDAYPLVISLQLPSPSTTKTCTAKENSRNSTFLNQKHIFVYVCINFFIVCHIIFYHFHLYIRLDLPTPDPPLPSKLKCSAPQCSLCVLCTISKYSRLLQKKMYAAFTSSCVIEPPNMVREPMLNGE